jgi:ABC-type Na+ transport system ATPase subunit NatA
LRKTQERAQKVKDIYNQENNRCSEILKNERDLCVAFSYTPSAEESALLFDELSGLLLSVKSEIEHLMKFVELREFKDKVVKQYS